jgi:hypothetical protein
MQMPVALILLILAFPAVVRAESPQDFAKRIEQTKAVQPVVNERDDGSFGSLSIGIQPGFVEDRAKLDPLLAQIGKFAAEGKLKADVLAPTQADAEYLAGKLKEAGVVRVATRVMAPTVSVKVTRVFLTPARPEEKKPAPPPTTEASQPAAPVADRKKPSRAEPKTAAPQSAK